MQVTKALRVLANKRQTLPAEEAREHPAVRRIVVLRTPPRPGAVPDAAEPLRRPIPETLRAPTPHDTTSVRARRGEPSAEELAALTVVVAALSQRRERRRPAPVGAWASYADGHRVPLRSRARRLARAAGGSR